MILLGKKQVNKMPTTTLTKELEELARKELNEVPNQRQEAIEYIQEWLRIQPHLRFRTDDLWILNFLRGCKFSYQKTKEKIELFQRIRAATPQIFQNRDPFLPELQEILKSSMFIPWSSETSLMLLVKWSDADTSKVHFDTMIKVGLMFFDTFVNDNNTYLITGTHVILDLKGFSFSIVKEMTPSLIKALLYSALRGYPLRVTSMHIINSPMGIATIYNLFKPLLTNKVISRIRFYGSDYSEMYKVIPESLMFEEYGGGGESMYEAAERWKRKIEDYKDWYLEDEAKYRADLSIQTKERKQSEILITTEGSFKKLAID